MSRGGFSWKRLTGISGAKARASKKVGVPFTTSGRERKIGRAVTGGGCLLPAVVLVLLLPLSSLVWSAHEPGSAPAAGWRLVVVDSLAGKFSGLCWSPSGRWLAGLEANGIVVWDLDSGNATSVTRRRHAWSMAWGNDNSRLYYNTTAREKGQRRSELRVVDWIQGTDQAVGRERDLFYKQFHRTPDGGLMAFGRNGAVREPLWIVRPVGKAEPPRLRIWLVEDDLGKETMLYARGRQQPQAIPAPEPLVCFTPAEATGIVAYKTQEGAYQTVIVDLAGKRLNSFSDAFSPCEWSPDGRYLIGYEEIDDGEMTGSRASIAVYSLEANTLTQLTGGTEMDSSPTWSPGGNRIAFSRGGMMVIAAFEAD